MSSKKVCKGEGGDECRKKALRSCARCRKNKIRCDSVLTRPHACTNCARKGVVCEVDYVTPPQRSKEMKYLFENVRLVEEKISRLVDVYDELLGGTDARTISVSTGCGPTRVLKLQEQYFVLFLDEKNNCFRINNLKIDGGELKKSFENFQKILRTLLDLYFKWDEVDQVTRERADQFVSRMSVKGLLERNELLLLLGIVNFYFDIPNLRYYDIFQYVIKSYCYNASNEKGRFETGLTKEDLAKLIVGEDALNAQFHSEVFIKNFTTYLFIHIVLYGLDYYMDCFMDKYIGTLESLRKKINFDKNWEVKWVNFYIRLLNLVEYDVNGGVGKYAVEEEEMEESMSDIEKKMGKIGPLESFIALIKFDQYLIERKELPKGSIMERMLLCICENVSREMENILDVHEAVGEGERLCYIHIFIYQIISLNTLLSANHCGFEIKRSRKFNGFNHEMSGKPWECCDYYADQGKVERLKKIFVKQGNVELPDYAWSMMDVNVRKHASRVDLRKDLVKVVAEDFNAYGKMNEVPLKILKSSCKLVWKLYEKVVYWGMYDKIYFHQQLVWNAKLLLENNGLMCQNEDCRSGETDASTPNPNTLNDMELYYVEPRRCLSDSGCYTTESGPYIVKEEAGSELFVDNLKQKTNYVNGPGEIVETGDHLRGGISRILQDVDWVKESADDVLRKIHGVLN